jgi:hypothetical protein
MNNKESFVEKLNLSGDIKYEMSEVHSRIIGKLKDVYETVFKREKKDFLSLKNMMYFKGGVASPDARPKLHEILDIFITLANHYDFLGDDEVTEYLKQNGIEIKITTPQIEDGPVDTKKYEKSWKFAMNGEKELGTKKEVLNAILDRALVVQKTIEDEKEQINTHAENVESECLVKKQFFMKAVSVKVEELKKKSVDNALKKMEDDVVSNQEIISVFDDKRCES